jgi:hypothetical protein
MLAGLSAQKLVIAVAYQKQGLPFGDRWHAIAYAAVAAWIALVWTLPRWAALAVAAAGGLASGILTFRLLRATSLFRAHAEDAR